MWAVGLISGSEFQDLISKHLSRDHKSNLSELKCSSELLNSAVIALKQRNTISKCKQINSSEQFWQKSSMSTTDLPSHLLLLMPVSRVTSGFALHRGELKSSLCLSTDSLGNCQEQKRQTQGCSHLFVQAKTILVIFSTYIHEVSSQFIILLGCSYISILRQSIQINCCFTWSVGIGSWSITDRSCFLEILTQNTNAISRT